MSLDEDEDEYTSIALRAGALKECPFHGGVTINQEDDEANNLAYAIATNMWKAGDLYGDRKDILDKVKNAIEMGAYECPVCSDDRDA